MSAKWRVYLERVRALYMHTTPIDSIRAMTPSINATTKINPDIATDTSAEACACERKKIQSKGLDSHGEKGLHSSGLTYAWEREGACDRTVERGSHRVRGGVMACMLNHLHDRSLNKGDGLPPPSLPPLLLLSPINLHPARARTDDDHDGLGHAERRKEAHVYGEARFPEHLRYR